MDDVGLGVLGKDSQWANIGRGLSIAIKCKGPPGTVFSGRPFAFCCLLQGPAKADTEVVEFIDFVGGVVQVVVPVRVFVVLYWAGAVFLTLQGIDVVLHAQANAGFGNFVYRPNGPFIDQPGGRLAFRPGKSPVSILFGLGCQTSYPSHTARTPPGCPGAGSILPTCPGPNWIAAPALFLQ